LVAPDDPRYGIPPAGRFAHDQLRAAGNDVLDNLIDAAVVAAQHEDALALRYVWDAVVAMGDAEHLLVLHLAVERLVREKIRYP
jgi:hypothetical protein